jgi:hypothetical protein
VELLVGLARVRPAASNERGRVLTDYPEEKTL